MNYRGDREFACSDNTTAFTLHNVDYRLIRNTAGSGCTRPIDHVFPQLLIVLPLGAHLADQADVSRSPRSVG